MISIRAKLIAFALSTIVIVATVLTALTITYARTQMISDFEAQLHISADAISEAIYDSLYMLDIRRLRFQLNVAKTNSTLSTAYVLDGNGRVLTDGTDENPMRDLQLSDDFAFRARYAKSGSPKSAAIRSRSAGQSRRKDSGPMAHWFCTTLWINSTGASAALRNSI